ncbi:MAG: hypothetical protein JO053_13595 [Acidobacteria bacterium]|nr:hypothetical protein [Acidobacteriota bacterium]
MKAEISMIKFNDFITNPKTLRVAARRLAEKISVSSRIAKAASSPKGREIAYALKSELLQKAVAAFPGFFGPVSFEYAGPIGICVRFKMPGGSCHIPIANLTTARSAVDFNVLPYKRTIRKSRASRTMPDEFVPQVFG